MSARVFFNLNSITLLLVSCASGFSFADDSVDFDTTTLQARGLSTTLNTYFREGKKFSPGMNKVAPVINGVEKSPINIKFSDKGDACLSDEDLAIFGIKPVKASPDECIDLKKYWPKTEIKPDPAENKLAVIIPQEAIEDPNNIDISRYTVGGKAAIFNYDLLMMKNKNNVKGTSYDDNNATNSNNLNTFQSNTEEGFNINDWIVRSRQSYSSSGNTRAFDQLYTYAQRTLPDYKTVMQAGKISVANSLFSTPQIYGIQFSPESALMNNESAGAVVTGIAQTQARVEVRQAGSLIYSTQVPSGPFRLERLPVLNRTADLNVNVIEQDGATRSFTVPASSFAHTYSQQETSYSAAIGKIDQGDNTDINSNELLTLNMSTPWGERASLGTGALFAQRYQGLAGSVSTGLENGLGLSAQINVSNDQRSQTNGVQTSFTAAMPVTQAMNVNGSVVLQNNGFRSLTDGETTTDPDTGEYIGSRYKSQYSLGLGYQIGDMGSLNFGWSRATMFDPATTTTRWTGGWSKTFIGGTSVSVNAERDSGENGDTMLYANISIPFGSARVGMNMSRTGDTNSKGVTLDQTINDQMSYTLAANQNSDSDITAYSANIHATPKYSQLNLGYSRFGSESSTYTLGATGGVVATKEGVLFSPNQIQDTFAVVQVPDISGGEISTPQGPAWTNSKGYAVSSSMAPYGESRLTLITKSLPKNVDINNAIQVAHVARGSVTSYTFGTVLTRRALITIHMPSSKLASKGDMVTDGHDNYLTTVAGDGTIFIVDGQLEQQLWLKPMVGQRCRVTFELNPQPEADKLYETYDAQCKN